MVRKRQEIFSRLVMASRCPEAPREQSFFSADESSSTLKMRKLDSDRR